MRYLLCTLRYLVQGDEVFYIKLKPEKTVGEYELSDIESESANEPDSKVLSDKGASGGPS